MKLLFVVDQYLDSNNGTTVTAERFARELASRGHEVRIACAASPEYLAELGYERGGDGAWLPEEDKPPIAIYPQKVHHLPLFQPLVDAQGYVMAEADPESLGRALGWADLVHIFTPFWLGHAAVRQAWERQIPRTAAFHVQPENLSSSIHLGRCAPFNSLLYEIFRKSLYRYVQLVHCPSEMIAGQLRQHGYTNDLRIISNGIDGSFRCCRLPKEGDLAGHIVVTMVGRYSVEKRQDVVIRGIAESRFRDRIVLVLAGRGPREKALRRLARRLGVEVRFGFLEAPALRRVLAMSDIYVHASDMETEAMSCMEAFATGLVPLIADSPLSATPQFALDGRSLFRAGDPKDLAAHLDWWLEHPEELGRMGRAYAEEAERYRIPCCVDAFEDMLHDALPAGEALA